MMKVRNLRLRWVVSVITAAIVILIGIYVRSAGAEPTAHNGAIVRTDRGLVRGTVTEKYRTFQGIPYAAPPVGERRWRSPQPAHEWSGVKDATKPGSPCIQISLEDGRVSGQEDCLYLNVTTPRSADPDRPRPVIVWVHGGAWINGAGSEYDAARMAAGGDVVVVTINYRLGIFGAFGYPGLAGSGTFGLEDQQAALRWVQRNIAAFGGNPHNVTLAGQSSGGTSVCAQLVSPAAIGLFHRAIIQSALCVMDWPENGGFFPGPAGSSWISRTTVETKGIEVAISLGCKDITCLRNLPSTRVFEQSISFLLPAFDTPVLPRNPFQALREGKFHQVPVMVGHTRDEMRLMSLAFDGTYPMSDVRYHELVKTAFGKLAPLVEERYPLTNYPYPSSNLAWAAVITDRTFACPALLSEQLFARHVPTYGYEFVDRHVPEFMKVPPNYPAGAYHGSELPFLFYPEGKPLSFTPAQQQLLDHMIGYWTRFSASGTPNGPDLVHWSRFENGKPVPYVQSLAPGDDGIKPVDLSAEHQCSFWLDQ